MFSQVSVCPHEVCLPHCMLGHTPDRYTPGQVHPRLLHPPWAGTPPAGTPPHQVHPHQVHPLVHAGIHIPLHSAFWDTPPPLCRTCWDTVNKQAVRIPLECILVPLDICVYHYRWHSKWIYSQ